MRTRNHCPLDIKGFLTSLYMVTRRATEDIDSVSSLLFLQGFTFIKDSLRGLPVSSKVICGRLNEVRADSNAKYLAMVKFLHFLILDTGV